MNCRMKWLPNFNYLAQLKKALWVLFLLQAAWQVAAQQIPPPPDPPRLVVDYTSTLSPDEQLKLETKLNSYHDSTSTQIAVVIISSTNNYPISDYAFQLGEKWGIGQKGKNNGALILVAKDDREVFIATGYGLEGAIPDILAKRIVESQIIPAFKQGLYYQGLDQATDTMIKLAAGEYTADDLGTEYPSGLFVILGIIALIILLSIYSSYRHAKRYAMTNGIDLFTAWQIINATRMAQRNSWGSFTSGHGSFGGRGSSGFGGFGGGSFGGGGAGGRW